MVARVHQATIIPKPGAEAVAAVDAAIAADPRGWVRACRTERLRVKELPP
jgi:hypothetical protein